MEKFLINAQYESETVTGGDAFAVEAPSSSKAKQLIREHVEQKLNGRVTLFSGRTMNIANMNLNRYRFRNWHYINFSSDDIATHESEGY